VLGAIVLFGGAIALGLAMSGDDSSGDGTGGTEMALRFEPGTVAVLRTSRQMTGYLDVPNGKRTPFELQMVRVQTLQPDAISSDRATMKVASSTWGFFNGGLLPPVAVDTPIAVTTDGRIVSGGRVPLVGNAAFAGGAPGTDFFAPALPEGGVNVGDRWTTDYSRPFAIEDQGTLHSQTLNRLMRLPDGTTPDEPPRAAIRTTGNVAVDVTVPLTELEQLAPGTLKSLSLPADTTASISYRGTVSYHQNSAFDLTTNLITNNSVNAHVDLHITIDNGDSSPAEELHLVADLVDRTRQVN
jgi:hypothetical protein